jgi:hypothetical protein
MQMLSESHADDMGDYEALVIVQAAGFLEGEILLYERLNMNHMLLQQYAVAGDERARRNMLSMCEHDPDLFAEVLAHFVRMAGERLHKVSLLFFTVMISSESSYRIIHLSHRMAMAMKLV